MKESTSILFVCMGNICRSPAGENVMRHLLRENGLEEAFRLDSAGTIDLHTGNAPDSRMRRAAAARGIEMTGSARQVAPEDFENFDWILAMDDDNYRDLLDFRRKALSPTANLERFCDFCSEHSEDEVPDPYYGGPEGFEKVLDLLEDGCANLIRRLR